MELTNNNPRTPEPQNRLPVFINKNSKLILNILIFSMLLALVYAYAYIFVLGYNLFLIKMASIIALAVVVNIVNTPDKLFNKLLMAGLIFHSLGDGALEASDNILYAMLFFALGHLTYGLIFIRDLFYEGIYNIHHKLKLKIWQYIIVALIICISVFIASYLQEYIQATEIPGLFYGVLVYIAIFALSVIFCVLHPACLKWIGFGVLLYVISDNMIAYNQFVNPLAAHRFLSWPLYYFAQLSIVYGLLNYHLNIRPDDLQLIK